MNLPNAIFLFVAGVIGGAMNAVAGGGSFIAFPAMLFTGIAPIPANASNTFSLWVGTAASGGAYRDHLKLPRRILIPLLIMGLLGGVAGALLLIKTPVRTFLRLIPWLMLAATLLFTFGKHLTGRLSARISHEASNGAVLGASIFELLVAIYGGYFGGGIGIMNLAMFAALGMTDIHEMNALKLVLVTVINGVATATFVVMGAIVWPQALVMLAGAVLGGYTVAHFAQKLPHQLVRNIIIFTGFGMTFYFLVKAYR
jgi:uncharacterized membrane protein YfcA